MESKKYVITGTSCLLMHNIQLADPRNQFSKDLKAISGKRKKTEEDYLAMSKIEFFGGLYLDVEGRPCLTADMVLAGMIAGAKKFKLGRQFQSSLFIDRESFPLSFLGPKDMKKRWDDPACIDYRAVAVTGKRIMRTRPKFDGWSATIELSWDGDVLNESDVDQALEAWGRLCGAGDYRPRFGRFVGEAA